MSELDFKLPQAKALVARILSDEYGVPVRPGAVKFGNEGTKLKMDVGLDKGTLSYNWKEIKDLIEGWIAKTFPEAKAEVSVWTTGNGDYLSDATEVSFSNITISGDLKEIAAYLLKAPSVKGAQHSPT